VRLLPAIKSGPGPLTTRNKKSELETEALGSCRLCDHSVPEKRDLNVILGIRSPLSKAFVIVQTCDHLFPKRDAISTTSKLTNEKEHSLTGQDYALRDVYMNSGTFG